MNRSIVACLYALFPTEDASWRAILETSIDACSHIDPPVSEREATDYPASRALAALERFRIAIEARLRQACGASFSECRVMQLLDEAQRPLRIGDIAAQLRLSTVNVARAVDRLSDRNWVRRMGASRDRKAVFVNVTDEGLKKQRVIARTIDDLGTQPSLETPRSRRANGCQRSDPHGDRRASSPGIREGPDPYRRTPPPGRNLRPPITSLQPWQTNLKRKRVAKFFFTTLLL